AVDGNPTTRWSSAFSDPQWIQVDLGSVQNIGRVWLNWENAYATNYTIQLSSDNSTWTTVYTVTNGPGTINDLAVSGSARYVRMYGTRRGTQYGYSLWDFQVYPALAPQPAIAVAGTNLLISWPNTVRTWTLQSSPILDAPNSWSNVTTIPYLLNSEYIITDKFTTPARFYRLQPNP
ncbi:MAG TPA: discoidin domain-containing protein, partial [Pseudomonadales bacterium]|nr:discoidin domain-containing protein [Pseudomonadales bacterium]